MDTLPPPTKRFVRKDTYGGLNPLPWVVLNHPLGLRSFGTWREAMKYATFITYREATALKLVA